ncbi:MAG TPA: SBBP repeat-containing protein [Patescibacteria group bacterium]|nr:SBBP repeat-containing protein [Patescibacteria group bacterium]
MRLYRILPGLVLSLLVGAPVGQAEAAAILTPRPARPALAFEPNQGQADPAVKFLARGRGFGLFLTQTETVLVVSPAAGAARRPGADGGEATAPSVVRMRLVGADASPTVTGLAPLPGRVHSLVGDPDRWRRDVPTFARVQYADVYPGISLVFYGREGQLEYDFVVAPNADPDAVVMAFDGAQNLKVDDDGDLVIATGAGDVRMRRPVIYQEIGKERRPIEGGYVLDGDRVRFRVAGHDPSHALIIDPVLGYSSILNGSSDDQGFAIAVDSSGNVYVTGTTISSNFPVSPIPVQATRKGESDVFVTKLDATGLIIVYSTFLGGSGADAGTAIAVDSNGSAYIAGTTNSNNFPTTAASFQPGTRGGDEAFVARLGPDGSALVFSTYLGSNGSDSAFGIALDGVGNAYVTGFTTAPTFPNNNAIPCFGTTSTGADVFVVPKHGMALLFGKVGAVVKPVT